MSENKEKEIEEILNEETEIISEENNAEVETEMSEVEQLKQQLEEANKKYLFLSADFDNFRKRTIIEKAEIIRHATEKAMKDILPVIDDFERGLDAMLNTNDATAIKEGMELIYNKFVKYLEQYGVKAIDSNGADFDTEYHEAIAMVPAPNEDQKGKVIDTVMKGYTLNEKVIRHSKVAVGQ